MIREIRSNKLPAESKDMAQSVGKIPYQAAIERVSPPIYAEHLIKWFLNKEFWLLPIGVRRLCQKKLFYLIEKGI